MVVRESDLDLLDDNDIILKCSNKKKKLISVNSLIFNENKTNLTKFERQI